jgi:hypothetical protein
MLVIDETTADLQALIERDFGPIVSVTETVVLNWLITKRG